MGRPTVVAGNASGFEPEQPTAELDAVEPEQDDAPPGSVLANLRAQAEQARQVRHLELAVGGPFGDQLRIRYRVLSQAEWDKYAVLLTPVASGGGELPPMSALNVKMMAAACETVIYIDDDGETQDLETGLDGRLAELLAYPLPPGTEYADLTPAEVVAGLFQSPVAMTAHAGELVEWMRDPQEAEPGEIVTAELEQTLGLAAALGFDPGRLLRADPVERPLLERALEHAARFHERRDEALAKRIVAELAAAMKRGGRR